MKDHVNRFSRFGYKQTNRQIDKHRIYLYGLHFQDFAPFLSAEGGGGGKKNQTKETPKAGKFLLGINHIHSAHILNLDLLNMSNRRLCTMYIYVFL